MYSRFVTAGPKAKVRPKPCSRLALGGALLLAALALPSLLAQESAGELRLTVKDSNGHTMPANGTLSSQAGHLNRAFDVAEDGYYSARNLPYGVYRVVLRAAGFADFAMLLDLHSAIPVVTTAIMKIAPVQTQVPVTDSATLVDPQATGTIYQVGIDTLRRNPSAPAGHGVIDAVKVQPGWLLEANGVLHPRGAEYDTQYVIDGLPMLENRSPAFAPALSEEQVQSVNIMTSDFPAEYGRKLGGVIEAVTTQATVRGLHGKLSLQGGSFSSAGVFAGLHFLGKRGLLNFSIGSARTDRYLDPPVTRNFTNQGSTFAVTGGGDRDLTLHDRVQLSFRYGRNSFQVPNELAQQSAGQRQDRENREFGGQVSYQHIFSAELLGTLQAQVRDVSASLDSNLLATPIMPLQDRGFRQAYLKAALSGHRGRHDWKAGADLLVGAVHESFSYVITDPSLFDPSTPSSFQFRDHAHDVEESAFLQDVMRLGDLTVSAGLRWDHYHLLADRNAFSPRLGVAYYIPAAGLVLRASYDRIFQTPAIENLLLASSPEARALNGVTAFLPVLPAHANYYEAGMTKNIGGKASWTADYFRREIDDMSDDDLLLNTGVSFPISFKHGSIQGVESKLDLPRWGRWSGYLSYSYLIGRAQLPVAGGLFLGADVAELASTERVPISQDQRNTGSLRVLYQVSSSIWAAIGANYSSGLPVELEEDVDIARLISQFGERVVGKVNFLRGKVRPSATIDASLGWDVWQHEQRSLRLQLDAMNLGDRLNVINFAGLFSGTAVAPGRQFSARLSTTF